MRWHVFALCAFCFLVVELSLRNVLVLRSVGNIAPSFVFVLMVFVAFYAPRAAALWAAWWLGLLFDLCTPLAQGGGVVAPIIGPHTLGYVAAAALVLQVRAMLLRRRALTLAVVTVPAYVAATLVAVVIYAIHGLYPSDHLVWADRPVVIEIVRRVGIGVYSGLLALVLNPLLVWSLPVWAFRATKSR